MPSVWAEKGRGIVLQYPVCSALLHIPSKIYDNLYMQRPDGTPVASSRGVNCDYSRLPSKLSLVVSTSGVRFEGLYTKLWSNRVFTVGESRGAFIGIIEENPKP